MQITANPLPTIQWRKDGVNLENIPNKIAGVTSSALSIFDAQLSDTGDYTFVLTNHLGSVTSSALALSLITTSSSGSSPAPAASSGGGAPSRWFLGAFGLFVTARWISKRGQAVIDCIDFRSHWANS